MTLKFSFLHDEKFSIVRGQPTQILTCVSLSFPLKVDNFAFVLEDAVRRIISSSSLKLPGFSCSSRPKYILFFFEFSAFFEVTAFGCIIKNEEKVLEIGVAEGRLYFCQLFKFAIVSIESHNSISVASH